MITLKRRYSFLFPLLLFSLLSLSFSQQHFMPKMPKEPLKECISGQLYYDCSVCACFPLQTRQNTANLIITVPFAICSLVFLFYYFTVKSLREKPGNIVLAVALASFVLNAINIIENTKPAWSYSDEAVDSASCVATGYVKVLATVLLNYYTMAFFVIYVVTIQKSSTSGKIKGAYVHGLALVIVVGVMGILGPLNMIGRTLHGTCGMKSTPGVWMSILSYGNLTVLGFGMMALARKYLKRMYRRSEMEEDFIRHYLLFLGVISNLYLAIGILDGIRGLMLNSEVLDAVKNGEIHLGITAILKTLLFNLCPALLLFARLREPMIYEDIKRSSFLCNKAGRLKEEEENKRLSLDLPNNEVTIDIKKGLLEDEKPSKRRSLNETKREKKKDIICSMLAGLNYFFKLRKERLKKGGSQELIKSPLNQAKHFIHYEILKTGAPQVVRELKRRKNKLSTGDLTVHAPELFDEMIELDHVEEAISQALYFVGNYGNLITHGHKTEEDGKAVFISSNASFILKEISKEELKILLKMLPGYVEYMKGNNETMLARIYGIFSFNQVMGNHENITMVLMKNVVGLPEEYVRDQYRIGANENYIHYTGESLRVKKTGSMKKKSFFGRSSNGGKIAIEGLIEKEDMMRVLKKDIEFLGMNGLKNYVLQVSVVNNKGVYGERLDRSVIREVKEIDEMSENLEDLIDDEGRWENVEDYNWEEIQSYSVEDRDIGDAKIEIQDFWNTGGYTSSGKLRKIETIWGRLKNYGAQEGEDSGKAYGKKFIECVESLL